MGGRVSVSALAFNVALQLLVCVGCQVCASDDGGATFHLAGVPQPGLSDATCGEAPYSLLTLNPDAALFVDYPSTQFPGPAADRPNSGRLLFESLVLPKAVTHLALPLTSKSRSSSWWANVSVR